jgi:pSer/pThr/pTyr-binding forkhead associated (FHA) protein
MLVALELGMARWRLRFNLQEIDLRQGRIVLGRAAECPITFEDALVSRHHAELYVTSSCVIIRDLGSRNGVRVNGVRIREATELQPNDRVRLGRDELVILTSNQSGAYRPTRPTGRLNACDECGREHAIELVSCPHCGTEVSAA